MLIVIRQNWKKRTCKLVSEFSIKDTQQSERVRDKSQISDILLIRQLNSPEG